MRIIFRCDPALMGILPPPIPAREAMPAWLKDMAPRMDSPLHARPVRTLKQCPPFVDAMRHGFMVLLPCDVQVSGGRFSWNWDCPPTSVGNMPRSPLSFHVHEQLAGSPQGRAGQAAIKFNSFWTIELPPGWSLYCTHPANRDDLPFRLLSGVVDSDRFFDAGINFPATWTDSSFEGTLPKGTPVAQCFPVPRESLTLDCQPFDEASATRFTETVSHMLETPGVYRKRYRVKR